MNIRIEQLNPVIGDITANSERILEALERAGESGADLLVLPEMALTGYPPQDLLENAHFCEVCFRANEQIAGRTGKTALLFGTVTRSPAGSGRRISNSALLCRNGEQTGRVDKTLLPTYDVFDDLRYFEPNREIRCLELDGVKLGVTICEDIWYNQNEVQYHRYDISPAAGLKDRGAGILINISASPYTKYKQGHRLKMLRNHARSLQLPVLYSNQCGANTEIIFDGNSMALGPDGVTVARAGSFEPDHIDIRWDPVSGRLEAEDDPARSGAEPAPEENFRPTVVPMTKDPDLRPGISFPVRDLFRAMLTGIRDYFRKSGIPEKAVLGLSGGIDSALVAVLAAEAIGSDHVTGLLMPGEFSSEGSVLDAARLAENLGIRSEKLPITDLYEAGLGLLSTHFAGTSFGLAEENLQSRLRGLLLMAWSNKFGPLLLTTGNKSELAVGYATLYGDMNGALNPIGDLYKTEVFEVCRWLNSVHYGREVIPEAILEKPPSAELRAGQKDTDSLPEYEVLDDILRRYIDLQQEAGRISSEGGHDEKLVREILRMVDLNEFKRFQAPPVLKLSSKSFGTGRRWPLVQAWTSRNR